MASCSYATSAFKCCFAWVGGYTEARAGGHHMKGPIIVMGFKCSLIVPTAARYQIKWGFSVSLQRIRNSNLRAITGHLSWRPPILPSTEETLNPRSDNRQFYLVLTSPRFCGGTLKQLSIHYGIQGAIAWSLLLLGSLVAW